MIAFYDNENHYHTIAQKERQRDHRYDLLGPFGAILDESRSTSALALMLSGVKISGEATLYPDGL